MDVKIRTAIFINKFVTKVCKLFGKNGSVYPGHFVYDILGQKNVLDKVKYPKLVIAVTGSSGKGSTTDLINHVLVDAGYDVCYNQSGSNGVLAATTLILNNCDKTGKFMHDVLLLECDERHLKLIFKKNKMSHLVITNVTRDQPARNGHPDIVFKDILQAIDERVKLVINADDPLVNRLKYKHKGEVITYGLDRISDSYTKSALEVTDYAYCPFCHTKLKYDFYQYGHIGSYTCPNCNFERGQVDYLASNVNYKKNSMKINNLDIYLNKDVLYAVYYTVAAFALCRSIDVSEEDLLKAINQDKQQSKRGKELILAGRKLTMLESKNENNLSYYQSMKYITNQSGTKTVILGFDNVSRRYQYNDLSWLWDVNFELLNNKKIDKIFCIGRFRYDVALRLELADIDKDKVILVDDEEKLIDLVKNKSTGDIYTMVCFDMTAKIKKMIEDDNNENI